MGACFSKSKDTEIPSSKRTSGKSRLATSENRLGTKQDPNLNEKQNYKPTPPTNNPSRKLGDNETNNPRAVSEGSARESASTREAAAKAAELRFNKQQTQRKESEAKLKSMAKMSKAEKGLS
ncbi:hypothetical protein HYPBUDRAFT_167903 [Hyphopichia burtonii NRRL Y-1933]|uniref:Uncharacterized protein n=1 Tax=Hyphopichia burtonii NRRL Y-1933 TaxID=984485 RepID=A0A1E4RFV4_9ASCO|nr:hypothetical protein HYPBUDRAFT_167903 [Hyphopichia burtonii NRRL Y-1933]ODV66015.1 hypothetical protein HYPBUDRAFT_167903 [Hyphopichia burtonii NRRL Y-1933]